MTVTGSTSRIPGRQEPERAGSTASGLLPRLLPTNSSVHPALVSGHNATLPARSVRFLIQVLFGFEADDFVAVEALGPSKVDVTAETSEAGSEEDGGR